MALEGLLSLVEGLPQYAGLARRLRQSGKVRINTLDAARPPLLLSLWRSTDRPMLVVTARAEMARQLFDQLALYTGDDSAVQLLPEPDLLPYERLASDRTTVHQRINVLGRLAGVSAGPPPLVVGSAYAVAWKTAAPQTVRSSAMTVSRGQSLDPLALARRWAAMGYSMEPSVVAPGQMSRRGGILDVFPPIYDTPFRLDFWGDVVDTVRVFDPSTQRSEESVHSVTVTPSTEMLPEGRDFLRELDLEGCSREARGRLTEELRMLAEGQQFEEMESYAGLVNRSTPLDYLDPNSIVVIDEPVSIRHALEDIEAQAAELKAAMAGRGEIPKRFPPPFFGSKDFMSGAEGAARVAVFESLGAEGDELPFTPSPAYAGRTRVLMNDLEQMLTDGRRVVLVSQQAPRLGELFSEAAVPFTAAEHIPEPPRSGTLTLVHGSLAEGWTLAGRDIVLLTDAEVFGLAKQRRYLRRRRVARQSFLTELTVGDYVVHTDHGVGRFVETRTRLVDEREREYLVLEYAAGDQLMVPSEQIDRVGPYVGSSDRPPSLTRLGTQEWNRMKARVRASTAQVARELLGIYAAREVVSGHPFGADSPWQEELEGSFPYVETPDQMRTIAEVKADMERPKPMDRIVAGDVGYGKTEVALRAAFKAVVDGYQVAVLVPTTVLAQQHFNTFRERLAPFPTEVEMLSRFRSEREQDQVVERLAKGAIDICIGTHRLIQKDVHFKELGLVIVDEEQRFGVAHKERLKEMRREVDVLSLSATPIPRTLYMAMAGVRDMSVMETPPEQRLPIKTYVMQFDDGIVREALLRELERGGQIFFVHNRVYNIRMIAERLQRLVPEASVSVGHGQMSEHQLESVMLEFADGKADVLVCTTIIESGLDMPNVNTMIVNDADRMGLAQLYQLRGRVGRGANRAYAYFFYNSDKRLTETAEKRLKTILAATELGAGFRIAMKDLEIRGAGNLLGTEQHGHIAAVGLDLYVRLLGEAVEELRVEADGGQPFTAPRAAEPSVDLPLAAHIPDDFVADLTTRLSLYSRMARLREPTEVDDIADEMKDRFGPLPEPVENLLFMVKVKLLALKAKVLSVHHSTGEIVLAGDDKTWTGLLGVQRPYGDGVRIGHTRVRLDIRRLGKSWRTVLQGLLAGAGEKLGA